jgi:hypothetical protein
LFIVQANRAEVFRQAFVKPPLRQRIVVIEKHMGEVVGHGSPGFFFEQVQHHEILVVTGHEEARNANGLALTQRSHLIERLIVFQRQNGQRHRKVEPVFRQQAAKHGAHLFEAQGHFTSFLLPCVGYDGEVRRVQLEPRRLRGGS